MGVRVCVYGCRSRNAGVVVEWFHELDWKCENRGFDPGKALMPLRKAFYLFCSFILHQINYRAIGIILKPTCVLSVSFFLSFFFFLYFRFCFLLSVKSLTFEAPLFYLEI